jgi:glycosyltransferase involved in cell wall biosynthesis
MGMALGKCVIISDGPATRGIVTPDLGIVVPPQDPAALRQALLQAWNDPALRQRLGCAAQQYARSLGGEPQLLTTLAAWLGRDFAGRA